MKGLHIMFMGLGLMIVAISLTSIANVTLAWTISAAGIVIFLISGYLFLRERRRRK